MFKFLLSLFILLPGDLGTTTRDSSHYWPLPDGLKEEAFDRQQDSGNTRHSPTRHFSLPFHHSKGIQQDTQTVPHPKGQNIRLAPSLKTSSPNFSQQLQDRRVRPPHPTWHSFRLRDGGSTSPKPVSSNQTKTECSAQNPRKEASFPHCQHVCAAGSPHKDSTAEK